MEPGQGVSAVLVEVLSELVTLVEEDARTGSLVIFAGEEVVLDGGKSGAERGGGEGKGELEDEEGSELRLGDQLEGGWEAQVVHRLFTGAAVAGLAPRAGW